MKIVLVNPLIPPNTGSIGRLCAATGTPLALIEPLGFQLNTKSCRRAGLDYHALANVHLHKNLDECSKILGPARLFAITSHGKKSLFDQKFAAGDAFLFGSETAGLPEAIHARFSTEQKLRLPMIADSRSLNLSNAASVVVYEAWRQTGFVTSGKDKNFG